MPVPPTLSDLRAQLDATFDDAHLDAFCLDHFPEVYAQFGRGQRRDEKVTLLLNHCRTKGGLEQLARLLPASQPPTASTSLNPTHLAAYLAAMGEQCARLETRPYKQLSELRGAPACLTLLETYEPLRFDLYPARARQRDGQRPTGRKEETAQYETLREAAEAEALQRETSRLDVNLPEVFAEEGHVALLGKAGSGKTTVLRLATAVLAAGDPALAQQQLGLTSVEPLPAPVLIALREFEHACQTRPAQYSRDVSGLLCFVDAHFEKRYPGRVPAGFRELPHPRRARVDISRCARRGGEFRRAHRCAAGHREPCARLPRQPPGGDGASGSLRARQHAAQCGFQPGLRARPHPRAVGAVGWAAL